MSRFFSSIGISIGFSSWRQHWDFAGGPVAKTLSSQCRGFRFSRGQETRSHMLQLRVWMLQLKILYATAKTQSCQTKKNKILLKKEKTALILGWFLALLQFSYPFLWSYSLILPISFMIQYVNITSNRFCLLNLQSDFAYFNFQTSKIYGFWWKYYKSWDF